MPSIPGNHSSKTFLDNRTFRLIFVVYKQTHFLNSWIFNFASKSNLHVPIAFAHGMNVIFLDLKHFLHAKQQRFRLATISKMVYLPLCYVTSLEEDPILLFYFRILIKLIQL